MRRPYIGCQAATPPRLEHEYLPLFSRRISPMPAFSRIGRAASAPAIFFSIRSPRYYCRTRGAPGAALGSSAGTCSAICGRHQMTMRIFAPRCRCRLDQSQFRLGRRARCRALSPISRQRKDYRARKHWSRRAAAVPPAKAARRQPASFPSRLADARMEISACRSRARAVSPSPSRRSAPLLGLCAAMPLALAIIFRRRHGQASRAQFCAPAAFATAIFRARMTPSVAFSFSPADGAGRPFSPGMARPTAPGRKPWPGSLRPCRYRFRAIMLGVESRAFIYFQHEASHDYAPIRHAGRHVAGFLTSLAGR